MSPPTILEASDHSLLVSFGNEVTRSAHQGVLGLFRSLHAYPVRGLVNLHPAYCSLLIQFDPLVLSHRDLACVVHERLSEQNETTGPTEPRTISVPVCYDFEFGPDLSDVAHLHGLSTKDVVELHAGAIYTVYFLGFVPGFAYLGMLPERLATPRLPSPRPQVPSGSVGIADRQTGIYPVSTPGGWRLIGRTPIVLFNSARPQLTLFEPGDHVRFDPISREQFDLAAGQ